MPRMRRVDWVDLALRVLAEEGAEAVTVARLCEVAERTRGSLYHHFADHDALLDAVLESWAERSTHDVIAATPPGPGAAWRLQRVTSVFDPRLEQNVRRLAERVPRLRPVVAAVDRDRIAHLEALGSGPDARLRAELEYAAFLGFQQLALSPERTTRLYAWFDRRLAGSDAE